MPKVPLSVFIPIKNEVADARAAKRLAKKK